MNHLYSLYDALVSISVPADKARAVVDAMEHDMTTVLATKQDLAHLQVATKQDLAHLETATKQDLANLHAATRQDLTHLQAATRKDLELLRMHGDAQYGLLRQEIEMLRGDMNARFDTAATIHARDLEALRASMTIRLGSMMVVGLGLLFAALKLT